MNELTPGLMHNDRIPQSLTYPDMSMAELVLKTARDNPNAVAYDFFGTRASYSEFAEAIETMAAAFINLGIEKGMRVTICMPNTPQAVISFYALNLIGAVCNMIHPLSAQEEIVYYITHSESVAAITLDQFYPKFLEIMDRLPLKHLILAGIADGLSGVKKALYPLTAGRKIKHVRSGGKVIRYSELLKHGMREQRVQPNTSSGDAAVIMYSGGTTGTPKGIELTSMNFNALALQTIAAGDCIVKGHKMLSIMPVFHGFGLGVCIHTAFVAGVVCILVPQFSVSSYAELLIKHKPHYIAGVPTLFEALLRIPKANKIDLSNLEGMFSGGDTLTVELKRKVDAFLKERGASVQVREGYGLTECVTASCLTPKDSFKEGSIGIPFPDTFYKIVATDTISEVPFGTLGEICLRGPTVMKGYLDDPQETALVLKTHDDGKIWLHTGDLGYMDKEGFVYFRQRIKRMIVSSGYSIFPSQVENILEKHEAVHLSCVIGVPDPYRKQKIKAFIVLNPGFFPTEETRLSIKSFCEKNISRYSIPYEFEFRGDLPKTTIGKVAFLVLEKEELEKTR